MASLDSHVRADDAVVVVVVDCGSWSCRVGVAGAEHPSNSFRTVAAAESDEPTDQSRGPHDVSINTTSCWNDLYLVTDWSEMERVWRRAFFLSSGEVGGRVPSTSNGSNLPPLLLTIPVLTPRAQVERIVRTLFESVGVAALHLEPPQTLAIRSASILDDDDDDNDDGGAASAPSPAQQRTGCVVDVGHFCTTVMPVFEGYPIPASGTSTVYTLGGNDLTKFMEQLLGARFPAWSSARHLGGGSDPSAPYEIARRVKEATAYVSDDFNRDMAAAAEYDKPFEREFHLSVKDADRGVARARRDRSSGNANGAAADDDKTLPTSVLLVASERFRCAEPLFQPALVGRSPSCSGSIGLPEHVLRVIENEEDDIQAELLGKVVLTGATVRIPGLVDRFRRELSALRQKRHGASSTTSTSADERELDVVVLAAEDPENAVWRGGSIMAAEDGFLECRAKARSDYFLSTSHDGKAPPQLRATGPGTTFTALESTLTLNLASAMLSRRTDALDDHEDSTGADGESRNDGYLSLPHSLQQLSVTQRIAKEAADEKAKTELVRERRRARFKKYIEERDEFEGEYAMGEAEYSADLRWFSEHGDDVFWT
jgi:actin-related protein